MMRDFPIEEDEIDVFCMAIEGWVRKAKIAKSFHDKANILQTALSDKIDNKAQDLCSVDALRLGDAKTYVLNQEVRAIKLKVQMRLDSQWKKGLRLILGKKSQEKVQHEFAEAQISLTGVVTRRREDAQEELDQATDTAHFIIMAMHARVSTWFNSRARKIINKTLTRLLQSKDDALESEAHRFNRTLEIDLGLLTDKSCDLMERLTRMQILTIVASFDSSPATPQLLSKPGYSHENVI